MSSKIVASVCIGIFIGTAWIKAETIVFWSISCLTFAIDKALATKKMATPEYHTEAMTRCLLRIPDK